MSHAREVNGQHFLVQRKQQVEPGPDKSDRDERSYLSPALLAPIQSEPNSWLIAQRETILALRW